MAKRTLTQQIQSIKDIYRAAKFIAQGGTFKVHLDWGSDEPRIKGGRLVEISGNCTLKLDRFRESELAKLYDELVSKMGLIHANQYDPDGFYVKFSGSSREKARNEFFSKLDQGITNGLCR